VFLGVENIAKAFFGDAICDLFAEPIERSGESIPEKIATQILTEYQRATDHEDTLLSVSDRLAAGMDGILTASRAIIAVSSPIPGHFKSTYADVLNVFAPELLDTSESAGDEETAALYMDLRTAAKKNKHWRARIAAYQTTGLEDKSFVQTHADVLETVSVYTAPPATILEAVEKCKPMIAKLRPGCCKLIHSKILDWCLAPTEDMEKMEALLKVAPIIDPSNANQSLQGIVKSAGDKVKASCECP
jgi:hypothetical protein